GSIQKKYESLLVEFKVLVSNPVGLLKGSNSSADIAASIVTCPLANPQGPCPLLFELPVNRSLYIATMAAVALAFVSKVSVVVMVFTGSGTCVSFLQLN